VVFAGYYFIPKKYSLAFLFIFNLVFYGWAEPRYLPLMLVSIAFNYCAALTLRRFGCKKLILAASVAINLALIGYFKYSGLFVSTVAGIKIIPEIPALAAFGAPSLPIGISFYTFQAISYLIDVYRGEISPEPNALKFGVYISLFPQLVAGPIVRYGEIAEDIGKRGTGLADVESGLKLFICGLTKKMLLANSAGLIWNRFAEAPGGNGVAGAWFGLVVYAFHIYFDFSGYSDMAVGLGRMLGFRFPVNFNYPYISTSVTDFWRRWHITLSGRSAAIPRQC